MTERNSAYTNLLMRHRGMLWRMCWKHAGNDRDRCQDLMQEVSIALWENFDKMRPNTTPKQEQAWVYWQARSVFYQIERRHSLSTTPIAENIADNIAEEETQHRKELIDELLSTLNPEEQRMVRMYLDGYPSDEIGKSIGVSRDTVYKRMQRIVNKLKKLALLLFALLFTSAIAVTVVPGWRKLFLNNWETKETVTDTNAVATPAKTSPTTSPQDSIVPEITVDQIARPEPVTLEEMPPLNIIESLEIPALSPQTSQKPNPKISIVGTHLFISGAEWEFVRVYDNRGRLIAAQTASDLCIIDLFPKGSRYSPFIQYVFVVQIGDRPAVAIHI
jgi:RNA polymerase sigma factor (sigma-70 family)